MVRGRPRNTPINDDGPAAKIGRFVSNVTLSLPAAAKLSGNVLSCGQGEVGQLGLGEDIYEKTRPGLITTVKDVVDICAGGMHNLCLTQSGNIYSFGCNDEGALGRDTTEEGSEFEPKKVDIPGKCIKISAGDSHSACLLDDGKVYAWGSFRDSHGNMGLTLEGNKRLPIEVLPNIRSVDIASGGDHLVILTKNGHIYTMGCAEQGQLGRVSNRAASGESRRGKTQLLVPDIVISKGKKMVGNAIWASTYCTFLRENHSSNIYAFGLNNYNQLGLGAKFEAKPMFTPRLCSFDEVTTIAGGQHHTLVLRNDNKVYSIGRKEYGRLGLGSLEEDAVELTLVESLADKTVVEISCGESTSFAITDTGEVYGWGMGSNQQLGTGKEDDEFSPVQVTGVQVKDKKVLKVSSGGQHSLFIVEDKANATETKPVAVKEKVTKASKKAQPEPESEPEPESTVAEEPEENNVPKSEDEVTSIVKVNGDSEAGAKKAAPTKGRKRKM